MYRNKKNVQQAQVNDIFCEMGNIGTGASMASLSHIIGAEVNYSPSVVNAGGYDGLSSWFGYAGENVAAVLIPFCGSIGGMIFQVYKNEMVNTILGGVLEREPGSCELDGRHLDILKEVANITASSYLTALSACSGCRIDISEAAVSMDMVGAIITELIGTAGNYGGVLCIGNRFSVNGADDSHILVMLDKESAGKLLEALEVEL